MSQIWVKLTEKNRRLGDYEYNLAYSSMMNIMNYIDKNRATLL